jgi:predicted small integral membrane protein
VWLQLHRQPSQEDLELLEAVLSSWFMIGRLGGFNAMNLQASLFRRGSTLQLSSGYGARQVWLCCRPFIALEII